MRFDKCNGQRRSYGRTGHEFQTDRMMLLSALRLLLLRLVYRHLLTWRSEETFSSINQI